MKFKIALVIAGLILLGFGVYQGLIFFNAPTFPEPKPTIQYSSPIGPTQEEPYILESEALTNG